MWDALLDRKFFFLAVLGMALSILLSVKNTAFASDLRMPITSPVTFFETEKRVPIDPLAIVADDDGQIIVGTADSRAWAARTDRAGMVVWMYQSDAAVAGVNQIKGAVPEFSGATVMADGSVWLVGSTPDAHGRAGLLVHLGRDGKLLLQQVIRPSGDSSQGAPGVR
jgi:hypothetical protein